MKKVFIIIPTHNRAGQLRNLLLQLSDQTVENHFIKIVVIVDGSTDGTINILKGEFPDVHVISGDGSWWYTKSINEGFRYAIKEKADYALTLNDDIKLDDAYLRNILKAASQTDGRAIIGSVCYTSDKPYQIVTSGVKEIRWWRNKAIDYFQQFTPLKPDEISGLKKSLILPGRGMLIPIEIVKKLNMFDEYFVQYHSDVDFCLRAQKHDYDVFICWDAIIHANMKTTSATTSYLKTSFITFLKGFSNRYSRIYLPHLITYNFRHGPTILAPVRVLISVLAVIKAHFLNKKI